MAITIRSQEITTNLRKIKRFYQKYQRAIGRRSQASSCLNLPKIRQKIIIENK
jgi:hypothetical protein